MLDKLASNDFSELIEQKFEIRGGDHRLTAQLVEVVELEASRAPGSGRAQPFSILLRAAPEPVLPQSIYVVEHPRLGAVEMFLVPVGAAADGMEYEAVFN